MARVGKNCCGLNILLRCQHAEPKVAGARWEKLDGAPRVDGASAVPSPWGCNCLIYTSS